MSTPLSSVLLVEDDPTMIGLLQTLLEFEGFRVFTAEDQTRTLAIVQQQQPDVMLMDVHLAQANGLDMLAALRADDALRQPCVIVSSGLDVHAQALAAGADDFVQKPYMPDELIGKIKKLLETNNRHG